MLEALRAIQCETASMIKKPHVNGIAERRWTEFTEIQIALYLVRWSESTANHRISGWPKSACSGTWL